MALPKLTLSPQSSGYTAAFGSGVIVTKLDGGASRYRRDVANPSSFITCTWLLNNDQYNQFTYFYYVNIDGGSLPFLIDLVLDTATAVERTAHIVPNTLQLNNQSGLSFYVNAQLEVEPLIYTGVSGDIIDESSNDWIDELGNEMVG